MLPSSHRLEGLGLSGASRNRADDELSDDEDADYVAEATKLTWVEGSAVQKMAEQAAAAVAANAGNAKQIGGGDSSIGLSDADGRVHVRQLVIGCSQAADAFLLSRFPEEKFIEVGTITAAGSSHGEHEEPQWSLRTEINQGGLDLRRAGSAFLDRLIVVVSQPTIPSHPTGANATKTITPGEEWRWVEPLFEAVSADQVVVLDTVNVSAVPLESAAEGKPQAPYLFQIGTSAFISSEKRMIQCGVEGGKETGPGISLSDVPDLPAPILLGGAGAAALIVCETCGLNAVALVSLVERVVDSSTLTAYEAAFGNASDSETECHARRMRYREAVKGFSKKLDGLYL